MTNRYQVVVAMTPGKLAKKIEPLINDGWYMMGSVAVTSSAKGYLFAQALTRTDQ